MADKVKRGRIWATELYPDSMNDDSLSMICDMRVPAFLSPLHDSDLREDDSGEFKKPHYHLMFMFEGNKSFDQFRELVAPLGAVGAERIESKRTYARYLCHLDELDPKKHIYPIGNVLSFGGADYEQIINLPADRYNAVREMIAYCEEHNIVSYSALLTYSMWHNDVWFRSLCDNSTFVMKEYLSDRRKAMQGYE